MKLLYSDHWIQKKLYRPEITDYIIQYVLMNSIVVKDKYWDDAYNALCRIPELGRVLKVVYRQIDYNTFFIITAFWCD